MKCQVKFLSTLSLRRATLRPTGNQPITPNFYPRSPCGERPSIKPIISKINADFYPRSPCGERRCWRPRYSCYCRFLSTLSLRRATQPRKTEVPGAMISIHALLAESDFPALHDILKLFAFLSTLSLRRATAGAILKLQCILDFYPRSPCGERRWSNPQVTMHT